MKMKSLAIAAALAASASASFAEDWNSTVPLLSGSTDSWSAGFNVTHLEAGSFTDTFTFTPDLGGFVSASLITIGGFAAADLDFLSASINGTPLTLSSSGSGEFALLDLTSLTGPLVLTVTGTAGPSFEAGAGVNASYAGTLNVTAIPEPGTLALAMAGLGVVGFLSRRRRS
jgi:hypothetical protein